MKPWFAVALLACGGPRVQQTAEPVAVGSASAGSAVWPVPKTPECPIVMRERPPGVSSYGSLAEAGKHLPTIAQDPAAPPLDLGSLARASNAFFVARPEGYLHESDTSITYHDAVFVQAQRVTLVTRLFDQLSSIPPHCGNRAGAETLAIEIVNPHLGHFRIRQPAGGLQQPTAPPGPVVATDPACACRDSYFVEDHFIDLDRGEHLRSFAQIYEDDCYHPGTPPVLAFSAYVANDGGVDIATPACSLFWNE